MYTSFSIENFRLFDQLTVEPLARVNLIAGQNNVGKTALLEAVWLHSGPNMPDLGIRLSGFRGIPGPNPQRLLNDLFYDFDTNRCITLIANGSWGEKPRTLKTTSQSREGGLIDARPTQGLSTLLRGSQEADVSVVSGSEIVLEYTDEIDQKYLSSGWWARQQINVGTETGPIPAALMSSEGMAFRQARMREVNPCVFFSARNRTSLEEDVLRFGEVELAGYADDIVRCLNKIDPRIKRLTTIAAPPAPMIYADLGLSRPVPMGFLGDGMGRLLSMVLAFHQARNGTILIDEVENGLHHSVLVDVWKNLNWLSCEFNVQVFTTTHSYECIVAANDAFTELESEELHLHRLHRQNGSVRATTYSKAALETNIDFMWELR